MQAVGRISDGSRIGPGGGSSVSSRASRTAAVAAALLLLACGGTEGQDTQPSQDAPRLELATPRQPISAAAYVAVSRGFFTDEGLDVELRYQPTGQAALMEVVRGRADLAITAETPIVHAALRGDTVKVLATIATTRRGLTVIGRRGHGVGEPADLRGKRIGVTMGTNVEYFLHLFLTRHDIPLGEAELVDLSPGQVVPALTEGRVDAVVSWEPRTNRLLDALGSDAVRFSAPSLYTWFWNVVGATDFVQERPETARAVLRALMAATDYLVANPEPAQETITSRLSVSQAAVEPVWEVTTFDVSLDQALLLTMEHQARWVLRRSETTAARRVPNFLSFVEPSILRDTAPGAVSVLGTGGAR